jgi:hypothetical protein
MLYVIGSGEYECTKVINGKKTYLKTYKAGELFGELSPCTTPSGAHPSSVPVQAQSTPWIGSLSSNIVQESAIKKRSDYENIISRIEILSDVQDYEKQQLCDNLK